MKIEYISGKRLSGVGRGVGRMLDGGLGASFVADVTRERESAGDFGNRGSMFPQISRSCVTSWARTVCAWTNGERGVKGVMSHDSGIPTEWMSMECGTVCFRYK